MRTLAIAIGLALVVSPALADWPHPIKWDQLERDSWAAASYLDYDTNNFPMTADDFLCTSTDWITDIEFYGWSWYGGDNYIDRFRITFWTDVPRTEFDESHPGYMIYECYVDPAVVGDPLNIGWQYLGDNHFKINLDPACWFQQEGSPENPIVYWISIQGEMETDGYADRFYWLFRDRYVDTWGDDAAYWSDPNYPPWYNWGWPIRDDGSGDPYAAPPALYDGPFPLDWEASADMCFRLSGIPEPASLLLLVCGLFCLRRR